MLLLQYGLGKAIPSQSSVLSIPTQTQTLANPSQFRALLLSIPTQINPLACICPGFESKGEIGKAKPSKSYMFSIIHSSTILAKLHQARATDFLVST